MTAQWASWVLVFGLAFGCSGKPNGGKTGDGEQCVRSDECQSKTCLRGFCRGTYCCAGGKGTCATCESGWACVPCDTTKEGFFCSDSCRKQCTGDDQCPATWACKGALCVPRPNPTSFVFPDGGFIVRRNATAEFEVEVRDAEDGFLDGGFTFRDDSRSSTPVVELPGHRVSYTFGPLDFQGMAIFRGFSRYGVPLETNIPLRVCRERQETCSNTTAPCCMGLQCSGSCQ